MYKDNLTAAHAQNDHLRQENEQLRKENEKLKCGSKKCKRDKGKLRLFGGKVLKGRCKCGSYPWYFCPISILVCVFVILGPVIYLSLC